MKTIKTDMILKTFKGEPLKNGPDDLTIGTVIGVALAGKTSNPTRAWLLGKRFASDKQVELKAEDVVFLKEVILASDSWFSIVQGQVIEILEGEQNKEEK